MLSHSAETWSPPRWLYRTAVGVVVLTFVMLTIGALVTSFQAGMSDNTWPRSPWHLFLIEWRDWALFIEHLHRFVGIFLGLSVAVLALGMWSTERRSALKWSGLVAIVVLLAAFGQLHGSLIVQQTALRERGELPLVDWWTATLPTLAALAVLVAVVLADVFAGSPGRGVRAFGVGLLVMVMVQGMLGGLRVYFNALAGKDLSILHAAFSQLFIAAALCFSVLARPRDDRAVIPDKLPSFASATAVLLYVQVVIGAFVRHNATPLAAKLHLLGAFIGTALVILLCRQLKSPGLPRAARFLRVMMHVFLGLQIMLGIEVWVWRFGGGIEASAWKPVSAYEAIARTIHTLAGYGLFAASARLAFIVLRDRSPAAAVSSPRQTAPELETVA